MTFATITVPFHGNAIRTYLANVSHAGRAFFAALLTIKPQQSAALPVNGNEAVSNRERAKTAALLNRMAKQHDALMPNFSAELRYLASRG